MNTSTEQAYNHQDAYYGLTGEDVSDVYTTAGTPALLTDWSTMSTLELSNNLIADIKALVAEVAA